MYEYDFVSVPVTRRKGQVDPATYQEVVRERSEQGWRLVQVLVEQPAAMVSSYQLIFERPAR